MEPAVNSGLGKLWRLLACNRLPLKHAAQKPMVGPPGRESLPQNVSVSADSGAAYPRLEKPILT